MALPMACASPDGKSPPTAPWQCRSIRPGVMMVPSGVVSSSKLCGILEEGKLRCVPGKGDAVAVDRNDAVGDFGSVREKASGERVAGRGG